VEMLNTVARKLFLDRGGGGQDRERQIRELGNAKLRSTLELESPFVPKTSVLQKKVFAGFGAFFWPENIGSPKNKNKKDLRRILERFLVPNMAHNTGLKGGKSRPGGAKISPEGQLPPLPPTFRAYG